MSSKSEHLKPDQALFQHSPQKADLKKEVEAGLQADAVYDAALPWWRAAFRRWLVKRLRAESPWLGQMQERYRTPFMDTYFFWTAIFGTHTFFMTGLPMFFFFADHEKARGLLYVTGLGIYISSYMKDFACTPRPYSPPVVRLSMSTHGLEYGFPSSHSTNSTSIALFLASWMGGAVAAIGWSGVAAGWTILLIYAGSVIFGRLYCGMHSTMDCIAGTAMGWACWVIWEVVGKRTEAWIESGAWYIPFLLVPLCLLLVHKYPEPVDDCPCFEDAIAMLSVMLGSFLGHWTAARLAIAVGSRYSSVRQVLQGSTFGLHGTWGVLATILMVIVKIVIGLAIIFVWRLIVKRIMLSVLPTVFRSVSQLFEFTLPTRKHYQAATEYTSVPEENRLRPVPSFVDLDFSDETRAMASALPDKAGEMIRNRVRSLSGAKKAPDLNDVLKGKNLTIPEGRNGRVKEKTTPERSQGLVEKRDKPHYDVDVLTKVVVYCGIGYGATYLIPLLLDYIDRTVTY